MTAEPITVSMHSSVAAASRLARAHAIHHLPVVDGERPVGMLHLDDTQQAGVPIGLGF
jgi:CBS domain-containing protein